MLRDYLFGLILVAVGVLLMVYTSIVGIVIGVILVLGGLVALFWGYKRRKATAS